MSANLAEFLKVLTIVVSMSSLILSLRRLITSMDTEREEGSGDRETGNKLPENDPAVQR